MPTHTPSPHRFKFLAPNPPSAQKPKPQSNLRHGITAQTPRPAFTPRQTQEPTDYERRSTPAKRFVIAPRHTPSGGRSEEKEERWTHTQATITPRINPLRKLKKTESIEESSPSSSANVEDEHGGIDVLPSIEQTLFPEGNAQEEDEDDDILFISEARNKRRRVSPIPHPPSSPSLPTRTFQARAKPPQTPVPASHRFRAPLPKTPLPQPALNNQSQNHSATVTTPAPQPSHTHRPHFILPPQPTSPAKQSTPLPETFSPARKNGKYISSGLASTLQSWIVETANTGYSAQISTAGVVWGRDREDGVRMKVRISSVTNGGGGVGEIGGQGHREVECFPGGMVFVRGKTDAGMYNASRAPTVDGDSDGGAEIRILLAGLGGARGKGGVKIQEGDVVGIRAPMWDVEVGEERWVVGVEWVVLS